MSEESEKESKKYLEFWFPTHNIYTSLIGFCDLCYITKINDKNIAYGPEQ